MRNGDTVGRVGALTFIIAVFALPKDIPIAQITFAPGSPGRLSILQKHKEVERLTKAWAESQQLPQLPLRTAGDEHRHVTTSVKVDDPRYPYAVVQFLETRYGFVVHESASAAHSVPKISSESTSSEMNASEILGLAKIFSGTLLTREEAILKFGRVVSQEGGVLHLAPLPQWRSHAITLELNKLKSGVEFVAGIVFDLATPLELSLAVFIEKWGEPKPMPHNPGVLPEQPDLLRFDLPDSKWTAYALLSCRRNSSSGNVQLSRIIFRRFEK